jgi:hypothetical protein
MDFPDTSPEGRPKQPNSEAMTFDSSLSLERLSILNWVIETLAVSWWFPNARIRRSNRRRTVLSAKRARYNFEYNFEHECAFATNQAETSLLRVGRSACDTKRSG